MAAVAYPVLCFVPICHANACNSSPDTNLTDWFEASVYLGQYYSCQVNSQLSPVTGEAEGGRHVTRI